MGDTMTLSTFEKLQVGVAGVVIANALLWLGFPTRLEALAHWGTLQAISAGLWALGLGAVCVPWAVRRVEPVAWPILGISLGIAYATAALGCANLSSPIFESFAYGARIIECMLVAWSLTGGITLLGTALWPFRPFTVGLPTRCLARHEVAGQIAPFARDPAFGP